MVTDKVNLSRLSKKKTILKFLITIVWKGLRIKNNYNNNNNNKKKTKNKKTKKKTTKTTTTKKNKKKKKNPKNKHLDQIAISALISFNYNHSLFNSMEPIMK